MDISVVIPVHNEAANIQPLVEEITTALEGRFDYEIIYVDDGSTDDTLDSLRRLKDSHPRLRVLRQHPNSGQSTSLRSGVQLARADWVVTLDGDGQNDPADIPALLTRAWSAEAVAARVQLVIGHRRRRQDSRLRRLSSRIANGIRAWALGDATPDSGCGLKVFPRQAFLDLPYFDHMHRFLPALIQRQGGSLVSVDINHRPRLRGESKYGVGNRLWVGILDLLGVMWLMRRAKTPTIEER